MVKKHLTIRLLFSPIGQCQQLETKNEILFISFFDFNSQHFVLILIEERQTLNSLYFSC